MAGDEIPGEPFGKYRVVGMLASGGMAQLYLAIHAGIEGFSKVVALKRILPHLVDHPAFIQMFLNEARLAARLDHPNIVRIYELGEITGHYFISMEYLPGEDLSRVLHSLNKLEKKMPLELVIPLVQHAAQGLHFAHGLTDNDGKPLGLVHRDVNPSNIIVTYHSAIKLVDFGIAKATTLASATKAGTLKGKFAYVSPEQVMGLEIDQRSDIFSLGIVLWELLTSKKLFQAHHEAATLELIKKCEIAPPSTHRPEIPAELDAITLRALAPDRAERFQTADELSDALESFSTKAGLRDVPKQLGAWLEELFGAERAQAKNALAQGRIDVASAQRLLVRAERTRAARGMAGASTPAGPSGSAGSAPPAGASRASSAAPRRESSPARSEGGHVASTATPSGLAHGTPSGLAHGTPSGLGHGTPSGLAHGTPSGLSVGARSEIHQLGSTTPAPLGEDIAPTPHGVSVTSIPPSSFAALPRPRRSIGILVLLVALTLASGSFWLLHGRTTAVTLSPTTGTLTVESRPEGALIFLDGEPTGLFTPAVLKMLPANKPIAVTLERAGFERATETVALKSGESITKEFLLSSSRGAR